MQVDLKIHYSMTTTWTLACLSFKITQIVSVNSWILAPLCVLFKHSLVSNVRSIDLRMVALQPFLQAVGQKTWRNSWKSLNKTWVLRPDPMSLACEGRWLYIVLYFKRNWLNCHSKEDLTHGFLWVFLVKKMKKKIKLKYVKISVSIGISQEWRNDHVCKL